MDGERCTRVVYDGLKPACRVHMVHGRNGGANRQVLLGLATLVPDHTLGAWTGLPGLSAPRPA
jgi:hypothetical protein